METITETLNNGNTIRYVRLDSQTCYHETTPEAVRRVLENARVNRERIRVFYGDTDTGRDWCEENDTQGRVGRSTGNIKIPLLLHNERSMGGGALLDHCVVKIMRGKCVLYQHTRYNNGTWSIHPPTSSGYFASVHRDGKECAQFKKAGQAERFIAYMQGERMNK